MLRVVSVLACIALGAGAAFAQTPRQIEEARVAADICYDQLIEMSNASNPFSNPPPDMRPMNAKVKECKRLEARHLAMTSSSTTPGNGDTQTQAPTAKPRQASKPLTNALPRGGQKATRASSGRDVWASGCAENAGTVYCDRYAGFAKTYGNLPASCDDGNMLRCKMSLCELSTYLPVIESPLTYTFDPRVFECSKDGVVNGRRQYGYWK